MENNETRIIYKLLNGFLVDMVQSMAGSRRVVLWYSYSEVRLKAG